MQQRGVFCHTLSLKSAVSVWVHPQFKSEISPNCCVLLEHHIKHSLSPLIWQFGEVWHANISNSVSRWYSDSLNLPLPTTVKGSTASLGGSYADECGRTGFLLSCGGLRGDVLSVLHLSHSGLSCLSTPSPFWPRFEGTDVNHWFAIAKLSIPREFGESRPVWIETGDGSTSSRGVRHLSMHNFRCDKVGVWVSACVSHLWLEFNGEDVLPSWGVLCIQLQRLERRVDKEQPENEGDTHTCARAHTHTEQ